MMKKIIMLLSVIGILLMSVPTNVSAAMKQASTRSTQFYGTITVMESDEWQEKPNNGGYYINQEYYVTKTVGEYVYIRLLETNNVKITSILPGSGFTIAKQITVEGGVDVLLKTSKTISSKTQILTISADIVNPDQLSCVLSYSPLSVSCLELDGIYIDKTGKTITKTEFDQVCNGVVTENPQDDPNDVPNSDTGSVVPYVAIGGGLIAIAGVYLFSRKSNKIYKI